MYQIIQIITSTIINMVESQLSPISVLDNNQIPYASLGFQRILQSFRLSNHLISGLSAGFISTLTLYPLELIKIRMQVTNISTPEYSTLWKAFTHVVRHEGYIGLYRGMAPSMIASAGSWGGYFHFYEIAKQNKINIKRTIPGILPANDQNSLKLNSIDHLAAGTEAGVIMVLIFNPLWLIKTRLALQGADNSINKYKGMGDALITIIREEGLAGLYKGIGPALLLTSHGAIQFASYETLKAYNQTLFPNPENNNQQSPIVSFCLGGMSKFIAATLTYPYQVVKSRMQQRISWNTIWKYKSSLDCIIKIYKSEGILGFFRGVIPNSLKVAPHAAITFLVYEESMKYLNKF